jgi:hypothetical protein
MSLSAPVNSPDFESSWLKNTVSPRYDSNDAFSPRQAIPQTLCIEWDRAKNRSTLVWNPSCT